ncbi:MAG: hypothetical protein M1829_003943 [Trizodia sp. TS-e1964]|nr:MAG: hypothetical protein M1829_003943 [Trizodia sp. TS-e1964]
MASINQKEIPATPRVISPSPTPSESREEKEGYFAPVTRSAKRTGSTYQKEPAINEADEDSDSSLEKRARAKSRSPASEARRKRMSGQAAVKSPSLALNHRPENGSVSTKSKTTNGHLSPSSAGTTGFWRELSRSPSPLGLIPIHRHWRSLIHRHEIPRKALHVSIGFFVIYLYTSGVQTSAITPWLMSALIPVATTDYLRHRFKSVNRLYIRCLGALMRESEVDGWNGVIWYLLGAWIVLGWFPKDVGVMGVLLLSWCDTAASTFGRAYGRYTIRLRKGKSLAGTIGAFVVGALTAAMFYGWLAPRTGSFPDDPVDAFMFTGSLSLPLAVTRYLGWRHTQGTVTGALALVAISAWTGFVGAASELVDVFGLDDNLTIPVLSGLGLWGFLKLF